MTLTATAATGYDFTGWSGGFTAIINPLNITVSSDMSIVANFTPKSYTVTTSVLPVTGGTVTGGGAYFYGTTAILTAMPARGYVFTSWSGDVMATINPLGIPVYLNKNITANFALKKRIAFPVRATDGTTVIIFM